MCLGAAHHPLAPPVVVPAGPFYGFNRAGAKVSQGVIDNWWRQGMMGGAKAHYDCIKAFSETDFTEDLKSINVPVLIMHATTTRSCRSRIPRCFPPS
jgi:pimeloyl-ACP methyl ester carboxylesterase